MIPLTLSDCALFGVVAGAIVWLLVDRFSPRRDKHSMMAVYAGKTPKHPDITVRVIVKGVDLHKLTPEQAALVARTLVAFAEEVIKHVDLKQKE